jgi:hypothetical protein
MSIALDRFIFVGLLANPSAVELFVVICVGPGCGLSNSLRTWQKWTSSWLVWKRAAILALDAATMMCLRIQPFTWI